MPMSGLHVATSGLNAARAGLFTTGHNIANNNVTGFSRQRVNQAVFANRTLNVNHSGPNQIGMGTSISGIRQIRDRFLDTRWRETVPRISYHEIRMNTGMELDAIFGELDGQYRLQLSLNQLNQALHELHMQPNSLDARGNFISIANSFITLTNNAARSMFNYQLELNNQVTQTVQRINQLVIEVDEFNDRIAREELGGSRANDLRDWRNNALDELASILDIQYKEDSQGRINITTGNNFLLLNGQINPLGLRYSAPGSTFVEPVFTESQSVLPFDATFQNARSLFNFDVLGRNYSAYNGAQRGSLLGLIVSRGLSPANHMSYPALDELGIIDLMRSLVIPNNTKIDELRDFIDQKATLLTNLQNNINTLNASITTTTADLAAFISSFGNGAALQATIDTLNNTTLPTLVTNFETTRDARQAYIDAQNSVPQAVQAAYEAARDALNAASSQRAVAQERLAEYNAMQASLANMNEELAEFISLQPSMEQLFDDLEDFYDELSDFLDDINYLLDNFETQMQLHLANPTTVPRPSIETLTDNFPSFPSFPSIPNHNHPILDGLRMLENTFTDFSESYNMAVSQRTLEGVDNQLAFVGHNRFNMTQGIIPRAQAQLDTLINHIVRMFNDAFAPQFLGDGVPQGLRGETGLPLFVRDSVDFVNADGTRHFGIENPFVLGSMYTLGNIRINPVLLGQGGASRLPLNFEGESDNRLLVSGLLAEWSRASIAFGDADPLNINNFYRDIVVRQAIQTSEARSSVMAGMDEMDYLNNRRLMISGVSLEEEMGNMIRFQHAYNASARVVSMIDGMIDTLVNRTGRVGL